MLGVGKGWEGFVKVERFKLKGVERRFLG